MSDTESRDETTTEDIEETIGEIHESEEENFTGTFRKNLLIMRMLVSKIGVLDTDILVDLLAKEFNVMEKTIDELEPLEELYMS